MNYSIEIIDEHNFIQLTIRGEITREKAFAMNQEAHKLGKENGIRKYLVDVTEARNVDTVLNNYEIAHKDMDNEMINRYSRVAFLAHPDDHSHDFIETVFQNAGHLVKLFRNKEEALLYLAE